MTSNARRGLALVAPLALLAGVTACSSSGSSPSTSPQSSGTSTAAAGSVDPCVVGNWISTGASGSLALGNGQSLTVTGGGDGEAVSIEASGAVGESYSAANPITLQDSSGATYELSYKGTARGQLQASNGNATLTLTDPQDETATLTKNGTSLGSQHPPATGPSTYKCVSGQSLSVTSGGLTVTWKPA